MPEYWEGHEQRECTEHRTTGGRAWCFDCTEWCYESSPCRGCELPLLRDKIAKVEEAVRDLDARMEAKQQGLQAGPAQVDVGAIRGWCKAVLDG